jgi:surface antigen
VQQAETPRDNTLFTCKVNAVSNPSRESQWTYGMRKRSTVATVATALALAIIAAGSASAAESSTLGAGSPEPAQNAFSVLGKKTRWQCAEFARLFSGIQLFGDARTWWGEALGKYARGFTPEAGSVLVFKPYGSMTRGHVAVVSQVLTDRIIQVTHANWSPIAGRRGRVEKDVTVVDVSKNGDWSQVKVFYDPTGDLGTTAYPTYGFIYRAARAAVQAAGDAGRDMGRDMGAAVSALSPGH